MVPQILLLILWFGILVVLPGFPLLKVVRKGDRKEESPNPLSIDLQFLESISLSCVLGLSIIGVIGDIFVALEYFSTWVWLAFVVMLYMPSLIVSALDDRKLIASEALKIKHNILEMLSQAKRKMRFYLGLVAITCFSIFSRQTWLHTTSTLIASDPWSYMFKIGTLKHVFMLPQPFVYVYGISFESLLTLILSSSWLDPIFVLRVFQSSIVQILSTLMMALFLKRLGLGDGFTLLGCVLYLSGTEFAYDTKITHARGLGYFFSLVTLYAWSFLWSSPRGPILVGFLAGAGILYHPVWNLPFILMLTAEILLATWKAHKDGEWNSMRRALSATMATALAYSSVGVRTLLFALSYTRFQRLVVQPIATQMIGEKIALGIAGYIREWLMYIEILNLGWITFLFSFVGIFILHREGKGRYAIMYFVFLLFIGLVPYTHLLTTGSTDPFRFLQALSLPEAIFAAVALQYIWQYLKVRLDVELPSRIHSVELHPVLSWVLFVLMFASLLSSTMTVFPRNFAMERYADSTDLLNAINFIKNESSPDIEVRILTYPPSPTWGAWNVIFGILAPRIVLGQQIALASPTLLSEYVEIQRVKYILTYRDERSPKEWMNAGFHVREFGDFLVAWK